ncbi:hypothetical protein C8Q80DRAFT_1173029 [Daedaleopsis nitida]|nr:hypothetical protein C8Q80DRAFT_1173029 [Daedaleopsis nitida]
MHMYVRRQVVRTVPFALFVAVQSVRPAVRRRGAQYGATKVEWPGHIGHKDMFHSPRRPVPLKANSGSCGRCRLQYM